jgi:hypothetical protein
VAFRGAQERAIGKARRVEKQKSVAAQIFESLDDGARGWGRGGDTGMLCSPPPFLGTRASSMQASLSPV